MVYTQANHYKYGGVHQRRSQVEADSGKLFADDGDSRFYMTFAAGSTTVTSGSSSVTVNGSKDLEVSAASNVSITLTSATSSGTWYVSKTDPVRKWDPVSRAIKITTFGSFSINSSLTQLTDVTFDYTVSNSAPMAVTLSGVDPDYSTSSGSAFHRNIGETGPGPEFVNDVSFKGVGNVNIGETGPDEEFFYVDPSKK
jgi:hypothetical protein